MKKVNTFCLPVLEKIVNTVFPNQDIKLEDVNNKQLKTIKKYIINELNNSSGLAFLKHIRIIPENHKELSLLSIKYKRKQNSTELIPCNRINNCIQVKTYVFPPEYKIPAVFPRKNDKLFNYNGVFFEDLW